MIRALGILAIVLICLVNSGCKSIEDEPPFALGSGGPGAEIRSTSLLGMQSRPPSIMYKIEYTQLGLTSSAKLDLSTHAMLEEVFPGKWRVEYEYHDMRDKVMKVPADILIYQVNSDELINRYDLTGMVPQEGARYKDRSGHLRLIPYEYFDVMPGDPF
jgi:hypothetical protein